MRRPPTTDALASHAEPSLADNALMLLKLALGIARTLGIGRS